MTASNRSNRWRKKDDDPKAKILQNVNPNVFPSFKHILNVTSMGRLRWHIYIYMLSVFVSFVIWRIINAKLFPRASERRVLPIVGVCKTYSHLHIFSSSHLIILTPSHLHTFSSSHLLIFTSSHPHIFSSSHLLIFTPSHLHIFSSSHLLIFTSSHPHIFTSSHLHIFTFSLALLLSCPLALSFFSISLLKAWAAPTRRHETQPFPTKWGSIAKNWCKIAISRVRSLCVKVFVCKSVCV